MAAGGGEAAAAEGLGEGRQTATGDGCEREGLRVGGWVGLLRGQSTSEAKSSGAKRPSLPAAAPPHLEGGPALRHGHEQRELRVEHLARHDCMGRRAGGWEAAASRGRPTHAAAQQSACCSTQVRQPAVVAHRMHARRVRRASGRRRVLTCKPFTCDAACVHALFPREHHAAAGGWVGVGGGGWCSAGLGLGLVGGAVQGWGNGAGRWHGEAPAAKPGRPRSLAARDAPQRHSGPHPLRPCGAPPRGVTSRDAAGVEG